MRIINYLVWPDKPGDFLMYAGQSQVKTRLPYLTTLPTLRNNIFNGKYITNHIQCFYIICYINNRGNVHKNCYQLCLIVFDTGNKNQVIKTCFGKY